MILYLLPCISFDANTFDICVSPPPLINLLNSIVRENYQRRQGGIGL